MLNEDEARIRRHVAAGGTTVLGHEVASLLEVIDQLRESPPEVPARLLRFVEPVRVLDQGFLRLVSVMGDDGAVVKAARVTTGKGRSVHKWAPPVKRDDHGAGLDYHVCKVCKLEVDTQAGLPPEALLDFAKFHGERSYDPFCIEGDRGLIRYMLREHHVSPFSFAEITIHFRCPVYVFRQIVRHWSWVFQEYSMRYSEAVDAMQATAPDAWRLQSPSNRQGSAGVVTEWPEGYHTEANAGGVDVRAPNGMGFHVSDDRAPEADCTPGEYLSARETWLHEQDRDVYAERLAFGNAKEQARKDLPLSNYTDVFAKARLRDLLVFLNLRLDEHAQLEVRQYAEAIRPIVAAWVPLTYEAFVDYMLEAETFSRQEMEVLRTVVQASDAAAQAVRGALHMADTLGELSKREKADFLKKLGIT